MLPGRAERDRYVLPYQTTQRSPPLRVYVLSEFGSGASEGPTPMATADTAKKTPTHTTPRTIFFFTIVNSNSSSPA